MSSEIPQASSGERPGQRYIDGGLSRCNDNEANVGARYVLDSRLEETIVKYESQANVLRRTTNALGLASIVAFLVHMQMYHDQQTVDVTLRYATDSIANNPYIAGAKNVLFATAGLGILTAIAHGYVSQKAENLNAPQGIT